MVFIMATGVLVCLFGFTPFTLRQTTKKKDLVTPQPIHLSEAQQDKRDLLWEATCIFLSVFPLGK